MTTSMNDISKSSPLGEGGKVVLGFSGGLDTSFCAKYLSDDRGYEVHSIIVNTGGFSEQELKDIENTCQRIRCKNSYNR